MAYITQTILENSLGAAVVAALTASSSATLTQWIDEAHAEVQSALVIGGYTAAVPAENYAASASDCPREIKSIAIRVWKRIAYERKDLSIPEDQIRALNLDLDDLRAGRVEIKSVSRATSRAPGGISVSDADIDSTDERARPQIFARPRWWGY